MFWIVATALAVFVAVTLALALVRRPEGARPAAAYDLDVYRDQLKEVDRDLARGLLSPADAERVRTEISRRILAADAALSAQTSDAAHGLTWPAVVLALVAVVGGSFAVYSQIGAPGYGDLALSDRIARAQTLRENRPSQSDAEASMAAAPLPAPVEMSDRDLELVAQLRTAVAARPGDVEGLRLLAHFEARLGNFTAAHAAQASLISTLGQQAVAQDYADYAELLILAAGGFVSPQAERALEETLRRDRANGAARYYMGLMMDQTGRPDVALRVWDRLLREGPEDAPWIDAILSQIERTAALAGDQYQVPQIGSLAVRGPSQEDIDAAEDLSPVERLQMIEGMVSGLGQRLATEGGPVEEWAQLISALGVLGRRDEALAILANAREVFAGQPGATDILDAAADRAAVE
ncbi:MAG: c-type cytochrome biogenesis protein CcmI [Pseudomonadota bacterium]